MSKIFYQSSMPRAGSTLLQNIIGQNPDFYVTPTSGLIDLVLGSRIGYNQNKEAKAGDKELWKKGFYAFNNAGLQAYTSTLTDKPYFLDKNRGWGAYYNLLKGITGESPKILFMVRDLPSIFASMEKKFRKNPDIDQGEVNNSTLEGITTHKRVELWANTHPIGYALQKLQQCFLDKTAQHFFFVRYEDLCNNPQQTLTDIYKYLGIKTFEHNFNYIPQITTENDSIHGIYGDHTIRNTLEALPNDSIEVLGEHTYSWIKQNFKWYFDTFKY